LSELIPPTQNPKWRESTMKGNFVFALIVMLLAGVIAAAQDKTPTLTPRSRGAAGDGKTDDRAAIETALNGAKGATVDGEGLTYAVQGNIVVTTDTDFRNAKLVQTMDPPDAFRKTTKGLFVGAGVVETACWIAVGVAR
jgi:hypothetical protein